MNTGASRCGPARIPVVVLVLAIVVLLASCGGDSFASNGERIYFTAQSASGQPIIFTGGVQMMFRPSVCADCHGPEGRGGTVTIMMRTFDVPDITWDHLTETHADHPPYTEETLRRAITEGIDPAGEPLDYEMPRWGMSEADLNDLVEFIKALR